MVIKRPGSPAVWSAAVLIAFDSAMAAQGAPPSSCSKRRPDVAACSCQRDRGAHCGPRLRRASRPPGRSF